MAKYYGKDTISSCDDKLTKPLYFLLLCQHWVWVHCCLSTFWAYLMQPSLDEFFSSFLEKMNWSSVLDDSPILFHLKKIFIWNFFCNWWFHIQNISIPIFLYSPFWLLLEANFAQQMELCQILLQIIFFRWWSKTTLCSSLVVVGPCLQPLFLIHKLQVLLNPTISITFHVRNLYLLYFEPHFLVLMKAKSHLFQCLFLIGLSVKTVFG